jgi:hypothetical protein
MNELALAIAFLVGLIAGHALAILSRSRAPAQRLWVDPEDEPTWSNDRKARFLGE